MTSRTTRPASLLAALLLVVGVAAGCTGKEAPGEAAPSEEASAPPQTAEPAPEVVTKVSVGAVRGRLPAATRKVLLARIRGVFDRWVDRAYLKGDYPRTAFAEAFPGFTSGAQRDARSDIKLMTNADIGARIEEVRPRFRRLRVDVLAVRRQAAAVTARFRLAFNTRGEVQRWVVVRGRLFLTRQDKRWRVFGYDVAKGAL